MTADGQLCVKDADYSRVSCCVLSGTCALPGEIEDLKAVSSSSLCHHTLLEISSTFTDQQTHTHSAAENQVHTTTCLSLRAVKLRQ